MPITQKKSAKKVVKKTATVAVKKSTGAFVLTTNITLYGEKRDNITAGTGFNSKEEFLNCFPEVKDTAGKDRLLRYLKPNK